MTTTNSLLLSSNTGGSGSAFASTCFLPASGTMPSANATEAANASTARTALTITKLGVLITVGNASTQTLKSRVAGADGTQVISITGGATGWVSDSTHSDSVTAGQNYDTSWATGGNTATGTVMLYAAQNTSPLVTWQGNGISNFSVVTGPNFSYPFGSADSLNAGESKMQALVRAAGTWKSLQIGFASAVTATVTTKSRKNTADGNQVISSVNPGANTTGQDTTHTDSVASGDLLAVSIASTAGSGTWHFLYSEFAGTISAHDLGAFATNSSGAGASLLGSTSYFWPWAGLLGANTTEASAQATLPYALTASKMRALIQTNTAATITFTSRKNGADGNQVISVSSGTAGEVEDTTHSDSYAATNTANIKGATGTLTTLRLQNVRMLVDDGSVTAAVNVNITGVSGTGAAGSVVPGVSPAAVGASGAGAAGSLAPGASPAVVGVSATGAAGVVTPSFNTLVNLAGVAAVGTPGTLTTVYDGSVHIAGASAAGAVASVAPGVSVAALGVSATGVPGALAVRFPLSTVLPVLRIMRNTPVPSIGGMGNTPVALIGKLQASGPEPRSVQVQIVGVSAVGRVAGLQISRNVKVTLVGVSAAGVPGIVVAA